MVELSIACLSISSLPWDSIRSKCGSITNGSEWHYRRFWWVPEKAGSALVAQTEWIQGWWENVHSLSGKARTDICKERVKQNNHKCFYREYCSSVVLAWNFILFWEASDYILQYPCDSLFTVWVENAVNFLRICGWTQSLTFSLLNSSGLLEDFCHQFNC